MDKSEIGPVTPERYMAMLDYSVDLQRIVEDLCADREIRKPLTGATFHYDMAVRYHASRALTPEEK